MIRNKGAFCDHDRTIMPVSMKIFSLPKFATQSPRAAWLTASCDSRAYRSRASCIDRESTKHLQYKRFLQS
jgi:hypothetical protein